MALPKQVMRWQPVIDEEIARAGYPWPSELILSLISYESGGKPGAVNPSSGASGLTQVMPATLDWYNSATGSKIPLETLRASTNQAARLQIRTGMWVLGRFWKAAYKWIREQRDTVPLDDLVHFGDAFFAAGPGKVKKLAGNIPRTWKSWRGKHPTSNITKHADRVWARASDLKPAWNLTAVDRWIDKTPVKPPDDKPPLIAKKPESGLIIALLILLAASLIMQYMDKPHEKRA